MWLPRIQPHQYELNISTKSCVLNAFHLGNRQQQRNTETWKTPIAGAVICHHWMSGGIHLSSGLFTIITSVLFPYLLAYVIFQDIYKRIRSVWRNFNFVVICWWSIMSTEARLLWYCVVTNAQIKQMVKQWIRKSESEYYRKD